MDAQVTAISDGITRSLQDMVTRGKSVSAYLNRTFFRQYQKAQIERWESQGSSEGMAWKQVDPQSPYGKWKRKKFASAPGGGVVTMVRTSNLSQGAQGSNSSYFYKSVDDKSITIGINLQSLPYAQYVGKDRPFMAFSTETIQAWHQGLRAYITKGTQ